MTSEIPNDALPEIFSYLNAARSMACRGVCRQWNQTAGDGCLILHLRPPGKTRQRVGEPFRYVFREQGIGAIAFVGKWQRLEACRRSEKESDVCPGEPVRRVRGHLPKAAALGEGATPDSIKFASDRLLKDGPPHMMGGNIISLRSGAITSLTQEHSSEKWRCAIRMEKVASLSQKLVILDLSASKSTFEYCRAVRCIPGRPPMILDHSFDIIIDQSKPKILRDFLKELDASSLRHLEQLSVRVCGNLEFLSLPPSLQTLDAGGCSRLIRVDFPRGSSASLSALDLGGCRKVQDYKRNTSRFRPGLLGPNTASALKHVVSLDISHVTQPGAIDNMLCNALQSSMCLESFSHRYGATDSILKALAESESARSGKLRLIDVAFSPNITDESVELLAKNAMKLERLNLRGCKQISAGCYNQMPVYLERRLQRQENEQLLEKDESYRTCSRKGDNLFWFCGK